MTIREYLTDLNNSLRGISLDSYIPSKWLYLKTQSVISDFLKKDNTANKQIFKLSAGWSELSCVEMQEVSVTECAGVNVFLCQKLMRSKYKLPTVYETRYGALIRQVTSVDFSNSYDPVFSARLWTATQKREFRSKKYYFIFDNFLYIPIPKGDLSSPNTIRVEGYFTDLKDVAIFNSKGLCGSCKPDEIICKSILDYDIVIPDYLSNDVKKEVINNVLQSYGKLTPDSLPNLNPLQITNQQKP